MPSPFLAVPPTKWVAANALAFGIVHTWNDDVRQGPVRRAQRGEASDFDNRIVLKPGVGAALVALNGLIGSVTEVEPSVWRAPST